MKIVGIIPSRYQSSRFPGKPLAMIDGVSMIRRVYEQCKKATLLDAVVVATDDNRIKVEVESFGGLVVMTSEDCPNGTARCEEVVEQLNESFDFVVNIQGDEPYIQPEQIDQVACILSSEVELGTLVKKIDDQETLFNPNTPKVVFNDSDYALYFSRQTIPFLRDVKKENWLTSHAFYKHIGIYAYRTDILKKIVALPEGNIEQMEKLEQLRWLENGFKIKIAITVFDSFGIDSPEDIEKVKGMS